MSLSDLSIALNRVRPRLMLCFDGFDLAARRAIQPTAIERAGISRMRALEAEEKAVKNSFALCLSRRFDPPSLLHRES